MYACEKILTAESKNRGPLTMHEVFADAIAQKVYYVKFAISSTGLPQWAIQIDRDFRQSSMIFSLLKLTIIKVILFKFISIQIYKYTKSDY